MIFQGQWMPLFICLYFCPCSSPSKPSSILQLICRHLSVSDIWYTSLCQCSTITSVLRFIFWMLQVSMCPWYSVLHKSSLIAARGIFFTARPHCSALDPWHCQLRQSHTGLWFDKITKSRDWNQGVFLVGLLSKI